MGRNVVDRPVLSAGLDAERLLLGAHAEHVVDMVGDLARDLLELAGADRKLARATLQLPDRLDLGDQAVRQLAEIAALADEVPALLGELIGIARAGDLRTVRTAALRQAVI